MINAAEKNKHAIIKYLTSDELYRIMPDDNTTRNPWNVALKCAAKHGHIESVEVMMPYALTHDNAFAAAAKYGHLNVMRFMVVTDPDVIIFNNNLEHALHKFIFDHTYYQYAVKYVHNLNKIADKVYETYGDYFYENNLDQARELVIREHSYICGYLDFS